jgi:hypothetical protein
VWSLDRRQNLLFAFKILNDDRKKNLKSIDLNLKLSPQIIIIGLPPTVK